MIDAGVAEYVERLFDAQIRIEQITHLLTMTNEMDYDLAEHLAGECGSVFEELLGVDSLSAYIAEQGGGRADIQEAMNEIVHGLQMYGWIVEASQPIFTPRSGGAFSGGFGHYTTRAFYRLTYEEALEAALAWGEANVEAVAAAAGG